METPTSEKYLAIVAMYRRDGHLTPESVVTEAKPKTSPLHDAFEWDDKTAGHKHRLTQAQHLIQTFRVKILPSTDDEVVTVRAFVHEPERASYAPVQDVIADPDRRAAQVERLRIEYVALRQRASQFDEFAAIVAATDALIDDQAA